MQAASTTFANFVRAQSKNPACFIKVQLPTNNGALVSSQVILSNATACKVTRTEDPIADVASFTLTDNTFDYSPTNKASRYGACFAPGVIDNKFLIYLGFRNL